MIGRWRDEDDLRTKAQNLRQQLGLEALLLTRSEEGMTLFDSAGDISVAAQAREVFDVTGAGDTVIATMAALVAAGLPLRQAMPLANRAGAIVVGKFGTATVFVRGAFCMTRIVVTGAAGFIGSNIIKGLNARGLTTSSRSTT